MKDECAMEILLVFPKKLKSMKSDPSSKRHFEDAHYENDGHIAIIAADMDGSISDGTNRGYYW